MSPRADKPARRRLESVHGAPDVVVEDLRPLVDGGRFPARAIVCDDVAVSADVFAHGHDIVRAHLRARRAGTETSTTSAMTPLGNDRFAGSFTPPSIGLFHVEVLGEIDHLATWRRDATRRIEAGVFDPDDPVVGSSLLDEAFSRIVGGSGGSGGTSLDQAGSRPVDDSHSLEAVPRDRSPGPEALAQAAGCIAASRDAASLGEALTSLVPLEHLLSGRPVAPESVASAKTTVFAQRERAAFSSWYECFPRSASPDPGRPGTLVDLIGRLDYVADLGFDVLYLPPIHPIGLTARKGRNNSTTSTPEDTGSPWAIGSPSGGHDAVAPELGTIGDFEKLVAEAATRGIEVALDLAFQCSPDHPWVTEHPAWFKHRPDGSVACAENPPKRYEDVYPLDFDTTERDKLFEALLAVTRTWIGRGVKIFRVDNPHTKPFVFWEWLIGEIRRDTPEVLFLAEAFTRPKVMHRLAKLGFDQSYTYFTWRDTKTEIEDYFQELSHGPGRDYFRPNVWPNTPDILAHSLQTGGRASFIGRLVLAAGLSSNYGIYGPVYELLEDQPVRPGSEEYLNSEKYEVRHFDLGDPRSIAPTVSRVNAARRAHRAFARNESLAFHRVDNDRLVCWSKHDRRSGDAVIGVVSLDPDWPQSGFVEIDLESLGIGSDEPYVLRDVLDGASYRWRGAQNFVLLDPDRHPAHLFTVERQRPVVPR